MRSPKHARSLLSRNQRKPQLRLEQLEERWTPATILALTDANALLSLDSSTPGSVVSTAITGLANSENVVGVDYNPADGKLYGVTSSNNLVSVNSVTGAATVVASLTADPSDNTNAFTALNGTSFGVDFNPSSGQLSVVSNTGQNLTVNVTNGRVTTQAALNPGTPNISATAYANNFADAEASVEYGLDATTNALVTIDQNGTVTNVGTNLGAGIDVTADSNFDIVTTGSAGARVDTGYATVDVSGETKLATIDLNTGTATVVGNVSTGLVSLRGLAVIPEGTFNFNLSSYVVDENGGTATITVSRLGGALGAVSVGYSVTGLSATAGADFTASTGTLNFADGQASTTFQVQVLDDQIAEGAELIQVSLLNPTGNAVIGADATAQIVIRDNEAPRTSFYMVTSANVLVQYTGADLTTVQRTTAIVGLTAGETVEGVDFRPVNGKLYALVVNGTSARIVTINTRTGAAVQVGSSFTISGTDFGVDFNPTNDQMRVVTNTGANLSINPDTGVVTTQTAITGGTPNFVAAAYTNSFAGAGSTVLYTIDAGTDSLYIQAPPATGVATLVGSLGVDISGASSFEIVAFNNQAFAALTLAGSATTEMYAIDLLTGQATLVGDIGVSGNVTGMASASIFDQYYSDNEKFVNDLYMDILGRQEEPGGYWAGLLDRGVTQEDVVLSIINSTEARNLAINDMFQLLLGRDATSAELSTNVGLMNNGSTYQDIQISILASNDYFTANGGTNAAFVEALHLDILGRGADPTAAADLTAQLDANTLTRAQLAASFALSTEATNLRVTQIYQTYLGRNPTNSELTSTTTQLQNGTRLETILIDLTTTQEYYDHVVL